MREDNNSDYSITFHFGDYLSVTPKHCLKRKSIVYRRIIQRLVLAHCPSIKSNEDEATHIVQRMLYKFGGNNEKK